MGGQGRSTSCMIGANFEAFSIRSVHCSWHIFENLVWTFWMEQLTMPEPLQNKVCCVDHDVYPPIVYFLVYRSWFTVRSLTTYAHSGIRPASSLTAWLRPATNGNHTSQEANKHLEPVAPRTPDFCNRSVRSHETDSNALPTELRNRRPVVLSFR